MTDDWLRATEEKKIVGAVMLDFTAAFHIIEHKILLEKLHCYGFSVSALKRMGSYLNNRSQTVFFNASYSEFKMLTVVYHREAALDHYCTLSTLMICHFL